MNANDMATSIYGDKAPADTAAALARLVGAKVLSVKGGVYSFRGGHTIGSVRALAYLLTARRGA